MKNTILSACILCCSLAAHAQDNNNDKYQGAKPSGSRYRSNVKEKAAGPPRVFIDLSTGINNHGGLLGVGAEVAVAGHASVSGGVGLASTWGYKFYANGKYFFNPGIKGWALGAGFTFNTGINSFKTTLQTAYGTNEEVTLKLHPILNAHISGYRYWRLGRTGRIYMQAGYSRQVTEERITQTAGSPISRNSRNVVRLLSPGGIILGVGFSIGL